MAIEFAAEVSADASAHNRIALLGRCDPNHLKTQRDMGMGEAQYVAEILGLHSSGNTIKRGKTVTRADLGRIRSVKISTYARSRAWINAKGSVTLRDGKVLRVSMMIYKHDGKYFVIGAVG